MNAIIVLQNIKMCVIDFFILNGWNLIILCLYFQRVNQIVGEVIGWVVLAGCPIGIEWSINVWLETKEVKGQN